MPAVGRHISQLLLLQHYYTVTLHGMDNSNIRMAVANSRGNARERERERERERDIKRNEAEQTVLSSICIACAALHAVCIARVTYGPVYCITMINLLKSAWSILRFDNLNLYRILCALWRRKSYFYSKTVDTIDVINVFYSGHVSPFFNVFFIFSTLFIVKNVVKCKLNM